MTFIVSGNIPTNRNTITINLQFLQKVNSQKHFLCIVNYQFGFMLTIHDRNIDYIEIKHLEKLTCVCGTPVYLKGVF